MLVICHYIERRPCPDWNGIAIRYNPDRSGRPGVNRYRRRRCGLDLAKHSPNGHPVFISSGHKARSEHSGIGYRPDIRAGHRPAKLVHFEFISEPVRCECHHLYRLANIHARWQQRHVHLVEYSGTHDSGDRRFDYLIVQFHLDCDQLRTLVRNHVASSKNTRCIYRIELTQCGEQNES